MIPAMEATKAVNFHRNNALVVSTSSALRDWSQVSERRDLDVDLSDCMDRAPAVGLGLALAQPDGKVLVLDCDATLRTNLGGLATIGESNPKNLVHFVFDDVSSTSTSGIPIKEIDNLDLAQIANSSGYAKTYEFDKLEELLIGWRKLCGRQVPSSSGSRCSAPGIRAHILNAAWLRDGRRLGKVCLCQPRTNNMASR